MLVQALVTRLENRLLRETVVLFGHIRRHYYRHRMIVESLQDGAEEAPAGARMHVLRVVECLVANDAGEALASYYETAPNRYYQALAGLAHLVAEYGDPEEAGGSVFLRALSQLVGEMEMELVRRQKVQYLLQSLQAICLCPLLLMHPIERWASSNFPAMSNFYDSGKGLAAQLLMTVLALVCFLAIRQMQSAEEGRNVDVHPSEQRLVGFGRRHWRASVLRWMPPRHSALYRYYESQLRQVSWNEDVETFYSRRLLLALGALVVAFVVAFTMLSFDRQQVVEPTHDSLSFTPMSAEQKRALSERNRRDERLLDRPERWASLDTDVRERLAQKQAKLKTIKFRWTHLLFVLLAGSAGYMFPLLLLWFRSRMRRLSMRHEVEQFRTMLVILTPLERMTVDEVIQWLERFSVHFREPLQQCQLALAAGVWQALERCKQQTAFPPLTEILVRLQTAAEQISLAAAFEDLRTDREYEREQRKLEFEKSLSAKAAWGKFIGFVPLYALVFVYLIVPMIDVSIVQMQSYYEQMKHLH
jgi:hypothetical protein